MRVALPEKKPRGRGWIWALILLVVAGAGVWYWRSQAAARQTASAALPGLRTQSVSTGTLEATLRLTGVTAAENYVSLTSPQLRGSRSGQYGRSAASFASGVSTEINVQSNAGKSNAASSGGKSSALIAATSRNGGSSSSSSSSGSSASSGNAPSSASGADGIGSTSAGFNFGGGGGGGFGGEFSLSLLSLAKSGSTVQKDQVVAEFDRQNMMNRVDDYKASVAQTEASYRNLVAQLAVGKKAKLQEIEKAKGLVEKAKLDLKTIPVLSAMDAERMKLAFESAEANYKTVQAQLKMYEAGQLAQIHGAEIELEQGKIELRRTENNAAKMIVKAPIPGLVVVQQTFRGSEFTPIQQGDQLWPGQFFMQVVDTSSMVVNATVNQVDAEKMRIGARTRVRFDAYPNLELPGHVMSVGGIATGGGARQSFVKELPIRIKLEKIDPRVIPDLSVSAEIILSQEENATIAPLAAVYRDEPNGPAYVYVRQSTGWTRREVELGIESYLGVAVRQGLKPGEIVALDRPPETAKS
ncbi:MAG: HlyD family efflux transporter periplasmic adaptor subunit [Bryobacteraceae bacterium]